MVFLVRHKTLDFYRAVKRISKSDLNYIQLIREAEFLKNLKHPQIPELYDCEEDQDYFYLIEEYLQGESLEAKLLHQEFITPLFICHIGIEVGKILQYMHANRPNSLIYGDLKPEHILIHENKVQLVDFGSVSVESEVRSMNFGTLEFAAPEQCNGSGCSTRMDIYSLGKILQYTVTKSKTKITPELQNCISRAMRLEVSERYPMVEGLIADLMNQKHLMLQRNNNGYRQHLLKKIVFVGSEAHIGCTHIAISCALYFQRQGLDAGYREWSEKGTVHSIVKEEPGFQRNGQFFKKGKLSLIPRYGPGICTTEIQKVLMIEDHGATDPNFIVNYESYDLLFLIAGGRDWEKENTRQAYKRLLHYGEPVIICNHDNHHSAREFAREFNRQVYCFPLDADPYTDTDAKNGFFSELFRKEERHIHDRNNRNHRKLPWKRSNVSGTGAGHVLRKWAQGKNRLS